MVKAIFKVNFLAKGKIMTILRKVDVVTCGECKHWGKSVGFFDEYDVCTLLSPGEYTNPFSIVITTGYGWDEFGLATKENFFCANGERKDGSD